MSLSKSCSNLLLVSFDSSICVLSPNLFGDNKWIQFISWCFPKVWQINLKISFADVLLIYAEAQVRADGNPNADAYAAINRVRNRADLGDLSGLSGTEFLQAVLDERKWELAFEGHRWADLVRYGKLIEAVKGSAMGNSIAADNIKAHHVLFPLPAREIQVSNGDLEQNQGY